MYDVQHVTPIWYAFTINATTNTFPPPSCPDAIVARAEVVVVGRPILSSSNLYLTVLAINL